MLLDGTLAQHLTNIDCEAHRQVESLTKVLAAEAKINEEMKLAAAMAIASCVPEEELRADFIIPSPFDPKVAERVADAVKKVAKETGVARI